MTVTSSTTCQALLRNQRPQALLLIDLQNDYFPGGSMELVDAQAAVRQAARLLESFRLRAAPIVHVQHLSMSPGASFFKPGTRGAEIHESLKPAQGETLVVKHYPNSFRGTSLLKTLQELRVEELVVAGMMTHMCVDTTVRAAADLGFKCLLASDACATLDLRFAGESVKAREVQLAYLAGLEGSFARVLPTRELVRNPEHKQLNQAAPRGWRRSLA